MLATLVIGLREGLEAALIVGIIAAFLRKNGESLIPMWVGVTLAAILSLAVGIGELSEKTLSHVGQRQWRLLLARRRILRHVDDRLDERPCPRHERRLEAEAGEALNKAGGYALAGMAFLAVLREGFETSVFLLATFSVAQSAAWAVAGAVAAYCSRSPSAGASTPEGLVQSVPVFRVTAGFLILVAAD